MSNYGQLGTQAVNMYNSISSDNRAQAKFDAGADARDLASEKASLGKLQLESEYDLAGGKQAFAKEQAQMAREKRELNMQKSRQDLEKQRAQINKVNAQAAKTAMKKAASVTGNKKKTVRATNYGSATGNI